MLSIILSILMAIVNLPHQYNPRDYQLPFLRAMRTAKNPNGLKRACCIWHRRAGKDKTGLNYMIPRMLERIGAYYYYFPTASMGRDILWDGIDRDGFRYMDHFPHELVIARNSVEMKIELRNGSIFKIRGTDKREPIGINPVGAIFSEYSRQNPNVGWDLIRPILAENNGWAAFFYTPRSKNHGYHLYRMARKNPDWFCQLLTVNDTHAITQEAIEAERLSGMSEELIQQEFYCSFDIGQEGSYYGRAMSALWEAGQIGHIPYEPRAKVYTAWDIGIGDSTAIWFWQIVGKEVRIIDYYESFGQGLGHYNDMLRSKPYQYIEHFLPHDAAKREFQKDGTVATVFDILTGLLAVVDPMTGVAATKVTLVSPHTVEQGIEEARHLLERQRGIWVDQEHCQHGIDCLENYHALYKEKGNVFSTTPEHDWSSHGADAFRYLAVACAYQLQIDGELFGYQPSEPWNGERETGYNYDPLKGMTL